MALADDTSGVFIAPIYFNPGSDTIGDAPDPSAPLGGTIIDYTETLDDIVGYDSPPPRGKNGVYGAFLIDTTAWFVDRFWITPNPVNYESIFSEKTITVKILNTFRYLDKQLISVDAAALSNIDVSITAGPSLPASIRKSEQITIDFTASFDGVASFDEPVDFTFDDV